MRQIQSMQKASLRALHLINCYHRGAEHRNALHP